MKPLNKYIKESLSNMKLDEASLLDDEDDLIDAADRGVKNVTSIGGKMYAYKVEKSGMKFSDVFSLKKLKSLKIPIIQDKFTTDTCGRRMIVTRSTKKPQQIELLLVNYILNMDNDEILNDPHTGYTDANKMKEKLKKVLDPKDNFNPTIHVYRSTNISHSYVQFDITILSYGDSINIRFLPHEKLT